MSVYLKKDGSKVLSLSDEEFEDLGWEEGLLLDIWSLWDGFLKIIKS